MWRLASQQGGVRALALQRQRGLTRYETVWTMLHTLRRAMVRPGRDRLRGMVEGDAPDVGGHEARVRGRQPYTKSLVAVAAEDVGEGVGRIRWAASPAAAGPSLLGVLAERVEPGSLVHTDGWEGSGGLPATGYRHEGTNSSKRGQHAHQGMPRVHRVASLLKRWLLGTHHGAVRARHLDAYLDELTFRFNRRTSRARGQLFTPLVQHVAEVPPVHWRDGADGERTHDHNL